MSDIKRKQGETFESFFRRFTKAVQQSGRIIQAKKVKYLGKEVSRNEEKKSALVREKKKKEREYLKKIGKIDENERYYKGRR